MIDERDRQKIVQRYAKRFGQYGVDLRTLNTGDKKGYRIQHEVHAAVGPMDGKTVLDIGCGLGYYYEFLRERGFAGNYIGYDLVPQFIESNRQRYPEAKFEVRDVSSDGIADEADYIVMCQVFNNKYEHVSNVQVVKEALRVAFASARRAVSIDMLSSHVNYEEPHLDYFSPEEMFTYGKSLTRFVDLRHDYLPYHFTLVLYRDSSFKW